MVDWLGGEGFDGALVFDECHRAKNCIAKQAAMGRKQNESKTSRVRPTLHVNRTTAPGCHLPAWHPRAKLALHTSIQRHGRHVCW